METIVSKNIEMANALTFESMQSTETTLDDKELSAVIDDLVNSNNSSGPLSDVNDEFFKFSESVITDDMVVNSLPPHTYPSPNGSDIENDPPLLPPVAVEVEVETILHHKYGSNTVRTVPYDPTENTKVTCPIEYVPSKIKILENCVVKSVPNKKLSYQEYKLRRRVLKELTPQEEDINNIPVSSESVIIDKPKHEPIIVSLPLNYSSVNSVRIGKKTISKDDEPPKRDEVVFESSDSESDNFEGSQVEKTAFDSTDTAGKSTVARKQERFNSNAIQRSRSSSISSSGSSSSSSSDSDSISDDSSSDSENEEPSSGELKVNEPQTVSSLKSSSLSSSSSPPSSSSTVKSSASTDIEVDEQQQQQPQSVPIGIKDAEHQPQPSSSSSKNNEDGPERKRFDLDAWCNYKAYSYVLVDDSDDFSNITVPNKKLTGNFPVKLHVHQCSEGGSLLKSLIDVKLLTKSEIDQLKAISRKYKTAQVSALNCNDGIVSTKTHITAVNANCMEYPEQLGLVSIRDIIKSLGHNYDGIKLAPSALGNALKKLSREHLTDMLFRKECVNNNTQCMSVYPFVYGAVPKEMSKVVKHLIVTGLRDYKVIQMAKSEGKTSAVIKKFPKNAVPFFDGELEASAHIYWQLYSLDLLNWKDDVTRSQLKNLLEYSCWLIPKTNKNSSDIRTLIAKYAKFNTKFITAECVLVIKSLYRSILLALESIKNGPDGIDGYQNAVNVWNYFMQQCKIHHYLCPHTKNAIAKHLDRYKTQIPYKLESVMAQNMHNNSLLVLSAVDVYSILRVWKSMVSANNIDRDLQLVMSDLYVFFAKLFANHIVGTGVYDVSNNGLIDSIKVVEYFAERYSGILNFNQNTGDDASTTATTSTDYFPVFGKKIADKLKNIILLELNDIYTIKPNGVSQLKLGADVMTTFLRVANAGLFKALSPLIYMYDSNSKCTNALIVEAITNYFQMDAFTRFNVSELWSRYIDDDVDEMDESGNVIRPFYDSDKDDVDTDNENSDSDDDEEKEDEADLIEELDDLKNMVTTPFCKIDQVPVKKCRRPYVKKTSASIASTSSSNKSNEIPLRYKFAAEKISRSKCVMCYKSTTAKSIHIESDIPILVHCCVRCHARITDDADKSIDHEAIVKRIKCRVAPPIAFSKETNCFLLNSELSSKRAHFDYNKLSPSVLNRKRKAAEANKTAKKPKVVTKSVNKTNMFGEKLD